MNKGLCLLGALTAMMAVQGPAGAAIVNTTPTGIAKAITAAKPGDTLVLAPGDYGIVSINKKVWTPAITIDGSAAKFAQIVIRSSTGINLVGGKIYGLGGNSHGIDIITDQTIRVSNMTISGAHVGVSVGTSIDIELRNLDLVDLISDGIAIGGGHKILVDHNRCSDFHPNMSTYDAQGNLLTAGDHPDCVQAWSRPGEVVADLTIVNNSVNGVMQGISLFNHVRNGVDDGGFDRVTIMNNDVHTTAGDGISLIEGRDSVVRNNTVIPLPGIMPNPKSHKISKVNIDIQQGLRNTACGNVVQDVPSNPATAPCWK